MAECDLDYLIADENCKADQLIRESRMKLSDTQRRVLERMNDGEELTYHIWGGTHYSLGFSTVLPATVDALRKRGAIGLRVVDALNGLCFLTDAGREAIGENE